MNAKSTGTYSDVCSAQPGGCVNSSHPDPSVTRKSSFFVNDSSQNKRSSRIALLLKLHEEERAIQQREFEAERRALEQEREWQRKYNLLVDQLLERRNTIKRNRNVVDRAVVAKQSVQPPDPSGNNSSSDDDNKSLTADRVGATDDTTVESSQRSHQKNMVICVEQQPNQSLPPVRADYPADQLHLDGIQQRCARAFSETMPKKRITIADSVMPTEGRTIPALPHEAISTKPNNQTLSGKIKPSSVSPPKCSLSVSEGNIIHLDQGVNEALYINGMQSRAPPAVVDPNVPDPAPPPLRLDVRSPRLLLSADGTLKCVGVFDGLTQLTPVKVKRLSDFPIELLSNGNVVMYISKRDERRQMALDVLDEGTIDTCNGAAESRVSYLNELARLHRRSINNPKRAVVCNGQPYTAEISQINHRNILRCWVDQRKLKPSIHYWVRGTRIHRDQYCNGQRFSSITVELWLKCNLQINVKAECSGRDWIPTYMEWLRRSTQPFGYSPKHQ